MTNPVYPGWMREIALDMYQQRLSMLQIATLTGISRSSIWRWCNSVEIVRSRSEAYSQGKGELGPRWKGDECGYIGQHIRAIGDFPSPLGTCQICLINPATERARIDHTNLPYRKEYVLPMCQPCNKKHNLYNNGSRIGSSFVILFKEVSSDAP